MADLRQQHGNHTWDIIVEYYRCPHCGFIAESREKFENRLGLYQKDFICHRCKKLFTITQRKRCYAKRLFS